MGEKASIYTEHLFAYLDILGFSQRIATAPESQIKNLRADLRAMRRDLKSRFETRTGSRWYGKHFSDSVTLSLQISDTGLTMIKDFCSVIGRFQAKLAPRGYFLRGGITRGKLYEDDALVFGPAMLRAIQMEQELAMWPRVVLDPLQDLHELAGECLRLDQDGLRYVDYLAMGRTMKLRAGRKISPAKAVTAPQSGEGPADQGVDYLRKHKRAVEKQFETTDERAYLKFCWLASYHNAAVEELDAEEEVLAKLLIRPRDFRI